jgi:ubiquitin carboxyl-terminal hydrolase 48
MEHTGIVPLYQKLLYEQIELDDNEKTVAELALPPNAVLSVLTFDQDMDDLDLDKFHGKPIFEHTVSLHL